MNKTKINAIKTIMTIISIITILRIVICFQHRHESTVPQSNDLDPVSGGVTRYQKVSKVLVRVILPQQKSRVYGNCMQF